MSDPKELVERLPKIATFSINPLVGPNIEVEGSTRFAHEKEVKALVDWADEAASLLESQAADIARVEGERDEARSLAGLGCDAANGGAHTVIKHPGGYMFCAHCGYTIKNPSLTERARKAEATIATLREEVGKRVAEEREAIMEIIDNKLPNVLALSINRAIRARALSNEEPK